MKKITIGILAHVDAGKTTLSESMLYLSGKIRQRGRVDHGDAFLDYDKQERDRGITIFSKQALIEWNDVELILIDTPGHVGFSSEMERTLQVLDYAIVVLNGNDGVQNHTETIWKLLEHYNVPTFIFVNKMDITPYSKEYLLSNIQNKLSTECIDFINRDEKIYEDIALVDEEILNYFLEHGTLDDNILNDMIHKRLVFPCFFGSALKNEGIEQFLDHLSLFTQSKLYPNDFGARVYKISYDEYGHRLTHLKITGGELKTKDIIGNHEKVDQIRLYNGHSYKTVDKVIAGDVCAVKGLKTIQSGEGLGFEKNHMKPLLSSYMNYRILLEEGIDQTNAFNKLLLLSEEDPELHIVYNQETKDIHIQLMEDIQLDILKNVVKERYGFQIDFDEGKILYKETILNTVEGVGHFEPLRHYAEVHLLLEPLEKGEGLIFESQCSTDQLPQQWQRLVITHLQEKEHIGVLTGSPITDMKITLVAGKAHQKHTEGGDFREATYRAVRQGLKQTQSVVLEPYFKFKLEIPNEYLSKALFDIEAMHGEFDTPITNESISIIEGFAPVSTMKNYQSQVTSYTKGQGKVMCTLYDYRPCHNQEEVISMIGYDSESDLLNPTGSVFCKQGAGFQVQWDEVFHYMHLGLTYKEEQNHINQYTSIHTSDEDIDRVMNEIYGSDDRRHFPSSQNKSKEKTKVNLVQPKPECLLVDGYNIIHAWDELKVYAKDNLEGARFRLMDMMSNYQGYKKCLLILVFDAYKVPGNIGSTSIYHNIHIVYTKEAQTADMYIEKVTRDLSDDYQVTVATSDALEQLIVMGGGAYRMSANDLKVELDYINQLTQSEVKRKQDVNRNYLLEDIKDYKE